MDINKLLFTSSSELGQSEIFHYTSVDAFFQIINNRTLRLSSFRYLNDYKELELLSELISPENLNTKSIKYNINRIAEIERLILKRNNQETYVASFTKHRDLLSQWRGYADNSKGVSIGFNIDRLSAKLKKMRKKSQDVNEISKIQMRPVLYNENDQYNELRLNRDVQKTSRGIDISSTSFWINSLASLFKSKSFIEEEEVRIIYMPEIIVKNNSIEINGPIKDLNYIHNKGYLKPYFDIEFDTFTDIISSVTIGANSKVSENELRRFLINKGVSVEQITIYLSNLTYKVD